MAAFLTACPKATSEAAEDPWSPPYTLHKGRTSGGINQATTTDGTTVVVFKKRLSLDTPGVAWTAIRPPSGPWGKPFRLADGRGRRPTVIAWGAGNLSVIWNSGAGRNTLRYHMRTLTADGLLGEPELLIKTDNASPAYRAAINSYGQVALAWSDSDRYDEVVVRQADGTWSHYPKMPVFHTGQWNLRIPEPRALFLDDGGRVSAVSWGTVGDSGTAIWLARPDDGGDWTTQQVQPVSGWVDHDHAVYVSNPRGDLAFVSGQRQSSGRWLPQFRFAAAGDRLGKPIALTDYECFTDGPLYCAGVSLAEDGGATLAYPRSAGGDDIVIEVVRRTADGVLGAAQVVSEVIWQNTFHGVEMVGNGDDDTVLSFTGGSRLSGTGVAFVRCPSASPCADATFSDGAPSWLDYWHTSLGDDAEATVTWSEEEWIRNGDVISRQLAAVE
jgi:hypothetical protein